MKSFQCNIPKQKKQKKKKNERCVSSIKSITDKGNFRVEFVTVPSQ